MKRVLFVFGTRPEAIKLVPLIQAFKNDSALETYVCVTAQHRDLLDPFLRLFEVQPEIDLDLMIPDQSPSELTARIVSSCSQVFARLAPDLVCVQGDTTSAFSAALSAALCGISVAHIEAGLRSHRRDAPFPEEINRVLISRLAVLHFAHSQMAADNLRQENIVEGVHVVGNTGIDALRMVLRRIEREESLYASRFPGVNSGRQAVLVTLHRRENVGRPLADICQGLCRVATECDVDLYLPVHPNPRIRDTVCKMLSGLENVHLLDPLAYPDFVWLLARATLVISDSGGVLEEAETLSVPVLVTREVTERTEALGSGQATLVGWDPERILAATRALVATARAPFSPPTLKTTFGDGHASERILHITKEFFGKSTA